MGKYVPVSVMKATVVGPVKVGMPFWGDDGSFRAFVVVENVEETWTSGGCEVHFDPPKVGEASREHLVACLAQYAADHAMQCDEALGLKPAPVGLDETIVPTDAIDDKGAEVAVSADVSFKRAVVADAVAAAAVEADAAMRPVKVESKIVG